MSYVTNTPSHYSRAAKVDITAVGLPGHALQALLALFWASLPGRLQYLDRDALKEQAASFYWSAFHEAMDQPL